MRLKNRFIISTMTAHYWPRRTVEHNGAARAGARGELSMLRKSILAAVGALLLVVIRPSAPARADAQPPATWSPLSTVGAPTSRSDYSVVWTGAELMVWGGRAPGHARSDVRGDGAR